MQLPRDEESENEGEEGSGERGVEGEEEEGIPVTVAMVQDWVDSITKVMNCVSRVRGGMGAVLAGLLSPQTTHRRLYLSPQDAICVLALFHFRPTLLLV